MKLELDLLPQPYAICRFPPGTAYEDVAPAAGLVCFVRSDDEVSAVLPAAHVQAEWHPSTGWRCLRVRGPLDLHLSGVLASLLTPLAEARVSVFPFATYDTDWLLVRDRDLEAARGALETTGHTVHG